MTKSPVQHYEQLNLGQQRVVRQAKACTQYNTTAPNVEYALPIPTTHRNRECRRWALNIAQPRNTCNARASFLPRVCARGRARLKPPLLTSGALAIAGLLLGRALHTETAESESCILHKILVGFNGFSVRRRNENSTLPKRAIETNETSTRESTNRINPTTKTNPCTLRRKTKSV